MKEIYGNNFLISIAKCSSSPTQAANIAQLAGYSKDQIRAVRNAAALLRDKGDKTFDKAFMPYEIVDVDIESYGWINIRVKLDRLYEKRELNAEEINVVAEVLEKELAKLGVIATIKRIKAGPYIKSTI